MEHVGISACLVMVVVLPFSSQLCILLFIQYTAVVTTVKSIIQYTN